MFWKKFLSRKFLLALLPVVAAIVNPELLENIPWPVVGVVITYIFGEGSIDFLRKFIDYKNGKNTTK